MFQSFRFFVKELRRLAPFRNRGLAGDRGGHRRAITAFDQQRSHGMNRSEKPTWADGLGKMPPLFFQKYGDCTVCYGQWPI